MLDKVRLKQSFSAASNTYDSVAQLQRDVGKVLLGTVETAKLTGTLLDLGCGTGFLSNELLARSNSNEIIALDIAWSMLQTAKIKLRHHPVNFLCADAERLPLAEHSIDSVFSNLALQWCINPVAAFADIKRVLKPDGVLVFSTFGPKTLQELKHAWAQADSYSHVNDFYTKQELERFLRQAGFKNIRIECKNYLSYYDSARDLMKELKYLGAHNALAGRNRYITGKTAMQNMIAAYETYRIDGLIPASFDVLMVKAS